jgi:hypothetical protein
MGRMVEGDIKYNEWGQMFIADVFVDGVTFVTELGMTPGMEYVWATIVCEDTGMWEGFTYVEY